MLKKFGLNITKPKKGDLPFSPRAAIYITSHTKDDSDRIFITPQDCIDMKELDYKINSLIKELEDIRKEAKQKLSA